MSVLDQIITGSTDDDVSITSLLRLATIIAHRTGSAPLGTWVDRELNGYRDIPDTEVPTYRGPYSTLVLGHYVGWGGRQMSGIPLGDHQVDNDFAATFFRTTFREPVTELEQLATAPGDPAIAWPPVAVAIWNQWEGSNTVPHFADFTLLGAQQHVPRQKLHGIVGTIRTTLLTLSLDLQAADPRTGETDGPTVTTPEIQQSIVSVTNHIYGHGTTIAQAPGVQQTTIATGDVDALIAAARAAGIEDPVALEQLTAAARAPDRNVRLRAFLDKLGAGTVAFATDVSGKVLVSTLTPLIARFLGAS